MAARLQVFAGAAPVLPLASSILPSDEVLTFSAGTVIDYPDTTIAPFCITIDEGLSGEEKILIGSTTASSMTVADGGRGFDGTTPSSHSPGAEVKHTINAVIMNALSAFLAANGTVPGAPLTPGGSGTEGSSSAPAAADHTHALPAFGTPAAPWVLGQSGSGGSAATFMRSDAKAPLPALYASTPAADSLGGAVGVSPNPSPGDHSHPLPSSILEALPAGIVIPVLRPALPSGVTLLDGNTRVIANYPALYAVFGTTYGGDGVTTFGTPGMFDKWAVGAGGSYTLGQTGIGAASVTLVQDQLAPHTHGVGGDDGYRVEVTVPSSTEYLAGAATPDTTQPVSATALDTVPPPADQIPIPTIPPSVPVRWCVTINQTGN